MKNIVLKIKRSFLTVCGIAVGVFAVVVISAVGDIGENLVDEKLKSMGMESIIVSSQNGGLQENDVEQLKNMDFVENAMPKFWTWRFPQKRIGSSIDNAGERTILWT